MTLRMSAGFRFVVFLSLAASLILSGCSGEYGLFGKAAQLPKAERFKGFDGAPTAAASPAPQEPSDPALAEAAKQAQELTHAIAKGAAPASTGGPPIRWIDVRHPQAREGESDTIAGPDQFKPIYISTPPPVAPPTAVAAPAAVLPVKNAIAGAQPAQSADPTAELLNRIRQSHDPDMVKALRAAAVSAVSGETELKAEMLGNLDPAQREMVQQYHQLLMAISSQLAAGGKQAKPEAIIERLDDLLGRQPVRIQRAELCTRVDNFGVYEPFGSKTFLAGREQPVILYVELGHFHAEKRDDFYEVRLEQDVVLYSEADGLAVWRLPTETIIDHSRNRRRDFFTVKMLHLPARLGVGKFQLKVRIKDLNGLSVDETSVPIQLVADQNLVSSK